MIIEFEIGDADDKYNLLAIIFATDILHILHGVRDTLREFVKYGPTPNKERIRQMYSELLSELASLPEELR